MTLPTRLDTDYGQTLEATELQARLGVQFNDMDLLRLALVHKSYLNEMEDVSNNERLEFLGDAIMNYVAGEFAFQHLPDAPEGQLTRTRSALVRTESLGKLALDLGVGQAMWMSRGDARNSGRERLSILCDAFEAIIGALYLDQGMAALKAFVLPLLEQQLTVVMGDEINLDARTYLQEWSQSTRGITPVYVIVDEHGPEHAKEWETEAFIGEESVGRGRGVSKRAAAQSAARDALQKLGVSVG